MIQKTISLGPIHPWLPGPMKIKLDLYGDQMVHAEPTFGYSEKGIEKKILNLPYEEASFLVSRVEPESAFLLDRMFFESVEKILGIPVEDRAVWIRNVTTQMNELMGLLKYLARMAEVLGIPILKHIILKHREELMDLIELFSGSRYGYYYMAVGGARYDLTEGFIERMEAWIRGFQKDYQRIESLFLWTHQFQNRLKSLGRVIDDGSMAFVSEAAIENTRYGRVSQVESRLQYSLNESKELAEELAELMTMSPQGSYRTPVTLEDFQKIRQERVHTDLMTSRGSWGLNLSLNSNLKIQSFSVETPSLQIRKAIPLSLEGEIFEDLQVILQSLNFFVTEIDR